MSDSPCGWKSTFPVLRDASPAAVRTSLEAFLQDSTREQLRAWDQSVPVLQREVGKLCERDPRASDYSAILEYELPRESRRADAVFLVAGCVVVLELKGKEVPSAADLDQAMAYGRDLECYHRACAGRPVHVVVVPMLARGYRGRRSQVHVAGPDALDHLISRLREEATANDLSVSEFLDEDAYSPLPSLVRAARELMKTGSLRRVRRAEAETNVAVSSISDIIRETARAGRHSLILLTGAPGAGKTLVGLRVVHAHELDDLSVARAAGKPTAPAVFLSGNAALVKVLQYELRGAGGGGKTFVRPVIDYMKKYSPGRRPPPEHVIVFDEAQRAWDRERYSRKHKLGEPRSEHDDLVAMADRIPGWSVVVALLGVGQEILGGEEGGIALWQQAVESSPSARTWTIYGPREALSTFGPGSATLVDAPALNLGTALRFHRATHLHDYVSLVLKPGDNGAEARVLAASLSDTGYSLRITRDLSASRAYLEERYRNDPEARYGLIASSRDKTLVSYGIQNEQSVAFRVRIDKWFAEGAADPASCRHLRETATEFQVQGLELDGALLAWGTDFLRASGGWSNEAARAHRPPVRDALALRVNAYRVLLTRARDGVIVFVPPLPELDETYEYLVRSGFAEL